jgi:hypothetical protein
MCVCVCIYIYICIHVCVHTYILREREIYIDIYINIMHNIYINIYTYRYKYRYMHAYAYKYVCVFFLFIRRCFSCLAFFFSLSSLIFLSPPLSVCLSLLYYNIIYIYTHTHVCGKRESARASEGESAR